MLAVLSHYRFVPRSWIAFSSTVLWMTLCVQDHNYTAPLPCTPPLSPLAPPSPTKLSGGGTGGLGGGLPLDDTGSTAAVGIKEVVLTTTTGEPAVGDDSITRCICDFQHDDGYMICCDQCGSVSPHTTCFLYLLILYPQAIRLFKHHLNILFMKFYFASLGSQIACRHVWNQHNRERQTDREWILFASVEQKGWQATICFV